MTILRRPPDAGFPSMPEALQNQFISEIFTRIRSVCFGQKKFGASERKLRYPVWLVFVCLYSFFKKTSRIASR